MDEPEVATATVAPSSSKGALQRAPAAPEPKEAGEALVDFPEGELPELLEITRGRHTLLGYPALADKTAHVELEVFDTEEEAALAHRAGVKDRKSVV